MKRNLAVICAQSPTLWVCSLIESLVYHAITQGGVAGYRQESGGGAFIRTKNLSKNYLQPISKAASRVEV